jgi:hypothetical protein
LVILDLPPAGSTYTKTYGKVYIPFFCPVLDFNTNVKWGFRMSNFDISDLIKKTNQQGLLCKKEGHYSIEPNPSFILEDLFYEKSRTSKDIALYSFLERCTYRNIPFDEIPIKEFCEQIGISASECEEILDYFHAIDFLTTANQS